MATDIEPDYEFELDTSSDDSLAHILRKITRGSEILELGPARGYLTRHLTNVLDCRVDCVERSARMAESVRPHARRLLIGDLDSLDLVQELGPASYDVVIAADVLEHLEAPARTLEACRFLLRPGGTLLVSVPNVGHASVILALLEGRFTYRASGLLDRTHRWFYTRESLLRMLRESGFRVEELERVVRMPETTEFRRRLDTLPPTLRDHLLRHPDALTYQFVVTAHAGAMSEERWNALLEPVQPAELVFPVKVYWAASDGEFSEPRHVASFARIGEERQRITFELPANETIGRLRIDPADRPGFVRLHALSVFVDAESERSPRAVVSLADPASIARACTFEGITILQERDEVAFLATTADPFFVVELDEPLAAGPGRRAVLEMSWPESADFAVARRWIESAELEHGARARELESSLERERTAGRGQRAAIEDLERTLGEVREHAASVESTLHEVLRSRGWRALEWLRGWKRRILPSG